ncbi:type II toxin-antitoxin system CcdA family antitoxin [Azospirillum picis]|uniref:Antitoxin CcdA n=1 Tax=Azospirillum picis TaxID=488438 RepID=A0ABU0MMB1_9PROT|nr:type II toxin-antitoxin system CcdA family antitoxin [Azospirillum picis]MBP2300641.1 antitoxin CcdA [Azospirillum picis]MDQ0534610.1 antitoxin CcdA [Azospirillum picis]
MDGVYDRQPAKREVTLTIDEDLLRRAEALTGDLSERVERLLAGEIARADRERRLDATIEALNEFDAKHGSFADDHLDHL